jgi:hypothetical protein
MPTLEDQLRRYGDVLDGVAHRTGEPVELAVAARPRRAASTALVAVALVVLASLIAVVASTRSTHEPSTGTSPNVAPTTTLSTSVPTTVDPTRAEAARQRAASAAWVRDHGGRVVDVNSVGDIAMSSRALYVLSVTNSDASPPTTLSRVDRQSMRVVSVGEKGAIDVSVGGDAVYLVKDLRSQSTVERLDPETLLPLWTVRVGSGTPDFAVQIAADADAVWVGFDNQLEQLDPQSGAVRRGIASSTADPNVGESIALDPTGNILYVVYGQGGGAIEPIEMRDAHSGARLALNPDGPGGLGPPQIAVTDVGVWVAYRTGMNGEASFFRANDLKRGADLVVDGTPTFGMGVELATASGTLWVGNTLFIACTDAHTGQSLNRVSSDNARNLDAYSIVADDTSVAVGIRGTTLGVFKPHDLCPEAK